MPLSKLRAAFRRRLAPALAAALAACSPLSVLDTLTPAGDYTASRDIAYGPDPRHRLDVYAPDSGAEPHPVIVFFYGGSWKWGERAGYRFVAESLTRQGFVVVVPDYRLYPVARYPDFLEDGARAVAWTVANIATYGGDPRAIVLAGHSAGAYNAVMLALDTPYLREAGIDRRRLAGVIGIAGPYDFLPLGRGIAPIFAPAGDLSRTQPVARVDGHAPPMLLVTGDADRTVLPRNTQRLAAALRAAGNDVREIVYPGQGHVDILLGLSSTFGDRRLTDAIAAFVETVAGQGRVAQR